MYAVLVVVCYPRQGFPFNKTTSGKISQSYHNKSNHIQKGSLISVMCIMIESLRHQGVDVGVSWSMGVGFVCWLLFFFSNQSRQHDSVT
ncbi:uncharacterized protein YALI1_A15437g [Yarrowia lipolytica]|uniref:Uncharacterized protein n=1 Tax=Yarrowia lipolytica TaxID=4952 RepID=A0A1D8N4X1_YARLL|nr:hypothetical protein YALI1_A15437g [Yarrowia lipolytica]